MTSAMLHRPGPPALAQGDLFAAETRATVVVVDDDLVSRNLATYLLSSVPKLRVLAAADAEEFNEICSREQPDLVLMDLRLPDSTGGELAHQLHQHGSPNVPIVAVTAYAEQLRTGEEPGRAEFVDVIAKPISADTFVRQIEAFLPNAR